MSSRVAGDVATTCGRVRLQLTLAVVRASCRAHEAKGDPSAREHTGGFTHSLCDCVAAEGRVQAEQRGRPPLPLPRPQLRLQAPGPVDAVALDGLALPLVFLGIPAP